MIYEVTIQHSVYLENGNEKIKKEQYLIDNCNMFADAEDLMYTQFSNLKNIDVIAIRRSKIKEIANARETQDDCIYVAEISDTFLNDDGSEKKICYQIVVFSLNFDTAKMFITEYSKQGYDMELISLKKSNFLDVVD